MTEAVTGLPAAAAKAPSDSVGAASQIASRLPAEVGGRLAEAAKTAFTEALGIAVLVGAGVAVIGSVLVAKYMPARHLPEWKSAESDGEVEASDAPPA